MKIKKIIALLSASAVCIAMTSCGKKLVNYTCDDYIDIDVSGASGKAAANVKFDRDLIDKINMDIYEGKADDVQLAQIEVYLYSAVDYDIVGETKELSNGDVITVILSPDNERLKDIGISFSETEYSYTVSGLTEPVTLDLFKDVEVTFEGVSPYLKPKVEYIGSDDFIKDNVYYSTDAFGYKNGDTLKLSARYNKHTFEENNYIAAADEKEMPVEGNREYAPADSDFSEIRKYLEDYAHGLMEKDSNPYILGYENDARAFFEDGSAFEDWKVIKSEITPKKAIVYTTEPDVTECSFNLFWAIDMEIEKIDESYGGGDNGFEIGDKTNSTIYFCTYINDIIREPDGTLSFDEDDVKVITYATSFWGPDYVGCDLDEVVAVRDGEKTYCVKTDLG